MGDTYNVSGTELADMLTEYARAAAQDDLQNPTGLHKTITVDPMAVRSGTKATLHFYADLPERDTPITNEYTRNDLEALITGHVEADIVTLNSNVAVTEIAELTSLDGAEKVRGKIVDQADRSKERWLAKNIAAYARMIRADLDTNYQVVAAATSHGASDGTTIVSTTVAGAGDDYWNGALCTIIDPESGVRESHYVTDYTSASGTLTFTTAFNKEIITGVYFQLTHFTGIASGDKLSVTNLREASALLMGSGHTGSNWEKAGGGYTIVCDSWNMTDLTTDSNLVNLFIYKEKESGLRTGGTGGQVLLMNPELTSRAFRCAVGGAGTYAFGGACDIALIVGRNAAARMPLEKNDVEVKYHPKTEGGHYNPAELYSVYSWKLKQAAMLKDPAGMIGIICYQARVR